MRGIDIFDKSAIIYKYFSFYFSYKEESMFFYSFVLNKFLKIYWLYKGALQWLFHTINKNNHIQKLKF